jgi:hypothetical protein
VFTLTYRAGHHGPKIREHSLVGLRRAQSFALLGIEIAFSREGRIGTRIITMSTDAEDTVSTVSIVSAGTEGPSGSVAGARK